MLTEAWLAEIHRRLIEGDPVAPAELAEQVYPMLEKTLSADNPAINDPDLISDACVEAFMNYVKKPATFDPTKRGLVGYLVMSAKGDLINTLSKLKRDAQKGNSGNRVELAELAGNEYTEPQIERQWDRIRDQLDIVFTDPKDKEAALLIIDGERSTQVFASVLECGGSSTEETEKVVKRHKDRIKAAMKRKMSDKDE